MATKAKKAPAKKAPKDDKVKLFDGLFARWKKGERICDLAAEAGVKRRGILRRQFAKRAGGKAEFKALRKEGAGGLPEARFGGVPKSENLDKNAKLIPIGGRKDWTYRHHTNAEGYFSIATTGKDMGRVEVVKALATEPADYLAEMGNGLPPCRLVKYVEGMRGRSKETQTSAKRHLALEK